MILSSLRWSRSAYIALALMLLCAGAGSGQSRCFAPSHRLRAIDYALLGTSTSLLAGDWLTSVDFLRRSKLPESNALLGPRPSVGRLNTFMTLTVIANLSVARISKPSLRRAIWIVVSAGEAKSMLHNLALGYHFNFRL